MKKLIIFLVATFVLVAFSNAQSLDYEVKGTEVIFTHIIENTGLSIKDAHAAIEAYYAKAFGDVNYTIKLNQEDHMIYKGIFSNVHYTDPFKAMFASVPYTMDVSIKDNRVRARIIVEEVIDRVGTGSGSNIVGLSPTISNTEVTFLLVNLQPIGDGKKNALSKKTELAIFDNMCERILTVFSNLDKAMKNVKVDEDW